MKIVTAEISASQDWWIEETLRKMNLDNPDIIIRRCQEAGDTLKTVYFWSDRLWHPA